MVHVLSLSLRFHLFSPLSCVQSVQSMGNTKARQLYEAHLPDNFRRPQTDQYLFVCARVCGFMWCNVYLVWCRSPGNVCVLRYAMGAWLQSDMSREQHGCDFHYLNVSVEARNILWADSGLFKCWNKFHCIVKGKTYISIHVLHFPSHRSL